MTEEFLYDVSRELRRKAIAGRIADEFPRSAPRIESALAAGRRVFFDIEEEQFFVEAPVDRVFRDFHTGRPIGAQRL